MPANTTALNAALAALTDQVAKTEGTEDSAIALIQGFATAITKAVADALTEDNKADDATIAAVTAAIEATTARFAASGGKLADAVVANPGS